MSQNIEFIKTKFFDVADIKKSIAVVRLNEVELEYHFWYSMINTWGKEETKMMILADVLKDNGYVQDAIDLIKPHAKGSSKVTINGADIYHEDGRNWAQIWLDNNQIEPAKIETDPLL